MKIFYSALISLLLGSLNTAAQVTDIADASFPGPIVIYGDDLYFSSTFTDLYQFDLSDSSAPVELLFYHDYYGLTIQGDILYTIGLDGRIHTIDLTQTTLTPVEIAYVNSSQEPSIAIDGTYLYYSRYDVVKRIDLADSMSSHVTIVQRPHLRDIRIDSGYLYYATDLGNTVERVDLSNLSFPVDTIVYSTSINPSGIYIHGNDIYITDVFDSKIYKGDLNQPFPITVTDFQTGIFEPNRLTVDGNDLYCSTFNKIVKIDLSSVSTKEVKESISWTLFPNPTQEDLNFDGLETPQNYRIIDALGRIIQEGTAQPNESISVQSLTTGIYSLQLSNGEVQRFIKQ